MKCTDIFGNELNVGDKVLLPFSYGKSSIISIAEVADVGISSITVTAQMHGIEIPDCYKNIKNNWSISYCYKLSNFDINLSFIDLKRLNENKHSVKKELYEITNRPLKVGDPVLVFHRNGSFNLTKFGVVISDSQVFVGNTMERGRHVFLLDNLRESEEKIINELKLKYMEKKQKKLSSNILTNYDVGDILLNTETNVYLYLGKKEIKCYNYEDGKEVNVKPIYNAGGHCYLKFNLNNHTENYIFNSLLNNHFKEYPYAKPVDFSVWNVRDAIAQHLHSKGFYEGRLGGLTVLKEKKSYISKLGHVDLSSIRDYEFWELGKNRGPRMSAKYIKDNKFLGVPGKFDRNVFSFRSIP